MLSASAGLHRRASSDDQTPTILQAAGTSGSDREISRQKQTDRLGGRPTFQSFSPAARPPRPRERGCGLPHPLPEAAGGRMRPRAPPPAS